MSGNCELGRGLRTREKNATERGAGRFEKTAPDARAAPPEAHESLISRKTGAEVLLTGLSFIETPPLRPRTRWGIGITEYAGRLTISFRYDATTMTPAAAADVLRRYVSEWNVLLDATG